MIARIEIGTVAAAQATLCRIEGAVNVIDPGVQIEAVRYRNVPGTGLMETDGNGFSLNINDVWLQDLTSRSPGGFPCLPENHCSSFRLAVPSFLNR